MIIIGRRFSISCASAVSGLSCAQTIATSSSLVFSFIIIVAGNEKCQTGLIVWHQLVEERLEYIPVHFHDSFIFILCDQSGVQHLFCQLACAEKVDRMTFYSFSV